MSEIAKLSSMRQQQWTNRTTVTNECYHPAREINFQQMVGPSGNDLLMQSTPESTEVDRNVDYCPSSTAPANCDPLHSYPSEKDGAQPSLAVLIFRSPRSMAHHRLQHGVLSCIEQVYQKSAFVRGLSSDDKIVLIITDPFRGESVTGAGGGVATTRQHA
jgi:hypothetical protein